MKTIQGAINLYKEQGETPLERVERFRKEHPEFKNAKITYAGRLDPLAEGVLLILRDETIKTKEKYLKLDKNYTFDIVLGIETDTYDVLGIIQDAEHQKSLTKKDVEKEDEDVFSLINSKIESLKGKKVQIYPPFSSKTVKGEPLFDWARKGKIGQIKIPKKDIEIYDLQFLKSDRISKKEFKKFVFDSIGKVKGDFRQEEIKEKWKEFFKATQREHFWVLSFNIYCSSGTYIRALAHELGKKLKIGAIAMRIIREKVGKYSIHDSIR